MKKLIVLLVSSVGILLSGCFGIPVGATVQTVRTSDTVYVRALVRGSKILCPSRVSLVVTNYDNTYPLEVAIDSETIANVPPNGKLTVVVPESPFTNGRVLVSGVLWGQGQNGRVNVSSPYQFSMSNYGPVQGTLTASNHYVSGGWQQLYSAYGY